MFPMSACEWMIGIQIKGLWTFFGIGVSLSIQEYAIAS
jgi:hypothetical protein